jgi:hypothetical protein
VERPGALRETRAQIEETGKMLSNGDVGEQTKAIIADLRSRRRRTTPSSRITSSPPIAPSSTD